MTVNKVKVEICAKSSVWNESSELYISLSKLCINFPLRKISNSILLKLLFALYIRIYILHAAKTYTAKLEVFSISNSILFLLRNGKWSDQCVVLCKFMPLFAKQRIHIQHCAFQFSKYDPFEWTIKTHSMRYETTSLLVYFQTKLLTKQLFVLFLFFLLQK